MRYDWLLTLRQAIPGVSKLWSNLRPTLELPGVDAIDRDLIRAHGIEGLIWDVDGTLMPRHGRELTPEAHAAFEELMATPGLRHVIVSNCGENRYRELGRMFPEIPILKAYRTRTGWVFRRRVGPNDRWFPPGANQGQTARPVRKPSRQLIRFALDQLEAPPERAVAVGDQYFTDIAPANLAGIRSIKVPTIGRESFPLAVRLLQRFEEWAYRLHRLRDRWKNRRPPAMRLTDSPGEP